MYDMYSWDQPANPADEQAEQSAVATAASESNGKAVSSSKAVNSRAANGKAVNGRTANGTSVPPVHAVQIALDRRDNGGDVGPRRVH